MAKCTRTIDASAIATAVAGAPTTLQLTLEYAAADNLAELFRQPVPRPESNRGGGGRVGVRGTRHVTTYSFPMSYNVTADQKRMLRQIYRLQEIVRRDPTITVPPQVLLLDELETLVDTNPATRAYVPGTIFEYGVTTEHYPVFWVEMLTEPEETEIVAAIASSIITYDDGSIPQGVLHRMAWTMQEADILTAAENGQNGLGVPPPTTGEISATMDRNAPEGTAVATIPNSPAS